MDLSSILPLLMNGNGGASGNNMASILSAMNGGGGQNNMASVLSAMNGGTNNTAAENPQGGLNNNMAAVLSAMNNRSSGGGFDASMLMPLLASRGGQNGGANGGIDIVNLMSAMNANKNQKRAPQGLKPIKNIVPNDILGTMVKLFS